VSFAAITLCVTSQRVLIVVYFVIDTVRKLLDTPSYTESKAPREVLRSVNGHANLNSTNITKSMDIFL
jgi:uncharacterized membrane protein